MTLKILRLPTAIAAMMAWGWASLGAAAESFSPDHPEVQRMIKGGVRFLTSPEAQKNSWDGADMFRAYTVLKATDDHDHPMVKAAIQKAQRFAEDLHKPGSKVLLKEKIVYEASVVAMLMAAYDPVRLRPDIERIRDFFAQFQKPSGGFCYLHGRYANYKGDISQSQYVSLALWSMKQVDIEINPDLIEKLVVWILNVQFPAGCWTYLDPSISEPTHPITAAGLSGALVSADVLGILRNPQSNMTGEEEEEEDSGIPGAFRRLRVDLKQKQKSNAAKSVTRAQIEASHAKARRWLTANSYSRPNEWHYYWLYSQERYESFAELLIGRRDPSPGWYNQSVVELRKAQAENGSWGMNDPGTAGASADTCFAVLFLLRNTQKAIGDIKSGESVGGMGLGNVADVGAVDGKLVDKSRVTSIEDAMKLLESPNGGGSETTRLADRIVLDTDPAGNENN